MRWCVLCEKMVYPQKHWSWAAFLLLFLLFGAGLWLYLPYYLLLKRPQCPSCGGKSFRTTKPRTA